MKRSFLCCAAFLLLSIVPYVYSNSIDLAFDTYQVGSNPITFFETARGPDNIIPNKGCTGPASGGGMCDRYTWIRMENKSRDWYGVWVYPVPPVTATAWVDGKWQTGTFSAKCDPYTSRGTLISNGPLPPGERNKRLVYVAGDVLFNGNKVSYRANLPASFGYRQGNKLGICKARIYPIGAPDSDVSEVYAAVDVQPYRTTAAIRVLLTPDTISLNGLEPADVQVKVVYNGNGPHSDYLSGLTKTDMTLKTNVPLEHKFSGNSDGWKRMDVDYPIEFNINGTHSFRLHQSAPIGKYTADVVFRVSLI